MLERLKKELDLIIKDLFYETNREIDNLKSENDSMHKILNKHTSILSQNSDTLDSVVTAAQENSDKLRHQNVNIAKVRNDIDTCKCCFEKIDNRFSSVESKIYHLALVEFFILLVLALFILFQ